MLAHLEATAAAAGAQALVLETGLRQPEAIALYESSGYTPVPGFGYYRDAPLVAVLREAALTPAGRSAAGLALVALRRGCSRSPCRLTSCRRRRRAPAGWA